MYCTTCGLELPNAANFCGSCGNAAQKRMESGSGAAKPVESKNENGRSPSSPPQTLVDEGSTRNHETRRLGSNHTVLSPTNGPSIGKNGPESVTRTDAAKGIGRAAYLGLNLCISVFSVILMAAASSEDVALFINLIAVVVAIFLVASRFKNIGYQPLWSLLAIVPIINLVIGYRCLAYPPGYANHKTLDTAGRIVTTIYAVVIGLMLLAVAFAMLDS